MKKIYENMTRIMLLAVVVNFIIEVLSRRSIIAGVVHLCTAPHIFIFNTIIILFTYSFCLLFTKRRFMIGLVSLLWMLAGIVDFILLFFRKTPFTAGDFNLIGDAFRIGPVYLGMFGFGAVIVLSAVVICGIFFMWLKASKIEMEKTGYLKALGTIGFMWLIVYMLSVFGTNLGVLPSHYSNIGLAYQNYGFAYCFGSSFFKKGIVKPDNYDNEHIKNIIDIEDNNNSDKYEKEDEESPNVIFLQLESFMNPNLIKNVKFNDNPTEYFQELVINYPSGYLNVPAFGAGTANTEFEIMTGMNLDDFGPGEYPYKTVLKNNTCETMAYVLRNKGYTTHAIHNNDATFYSRNTVFKNLGFDTFTSIEYMGEYDVTPMGWAKDDVLVDEINKALNSTSGPDYVYAVSVQGHGDYPDSLDGMEVNIYEEGFFDKDAENGFVYYVNQLNEMDDFIRNLVDSLSKRDEKTILVMYGDHLPGFSFTDEDLYNDSIYQTQYVIWSNYNLWLPKKNLEAYQLSSWVLKAMDVSDGILNKYHQKHYEDEDYLEKLTLLEYDMLYGDGEVYGENGRYEPTEMTMGIDNIKITDAYNYLGHICIEGNNFTPFSDVSIDGKVYNAVCINSHMLVVDEMQLESGNHITVIQRGEDKVKLSETDIYIYSKNKEN